MLNAFLPLMRPNSDSRIVNVSSVGSKLSSIPSAELKKRIRHAGSLGEVKELRDAYLEAVRQGKEAENGWPVSKAYGVSKALVNAATQVVAAENEGVLVNACCPVSSNEYLVSSSLASKQSMAEYDDREQRLMLR